MTLHRIKRTAWRGIAATVLGVGAIAFVAPTVTLAQEAPQKVDKDQVPEKVRDARQKAAPQGSDVDWYRTTEGGQTVYIAQFKGGGEAGRKREMRIAADGKVVREPGPASDLAAAPAAPAPGAGAGASEEEQLRFENERLAAELERVRQGREDEQAIQAAQGRRGRNQSPEVTARRKREQEQRLKNLTAREQAITDRQRAIQTRLDAIAASRSTLSAAERERFAEQDRLIAEKVRARREEERARLAREMDLADDRLTAAGGAANANVRYRGITAEDVPESVRTALDKYTRGKEDVRYRRELREDDISYSAHYVDPKDNKRYWVSINEDGTVNSAPRLSIYQPGTDNDVRLASGRRTGADDRAGDEIRHTDIARADVPRRALQALEKQTTGAKDLQYRREERAGGKVTYSVRYVQPNDKRYYMAVDENGNTVIEPRISTFQPGEKQGNR